MCVCVCVRARARACVCVRVTVREIQMANKRGRHYHTSNTGYQNDTDIESVKSAEDLGHLNLCRQTIERKETKPKYS